MAIKRPKYITAEIKTCQCCGVAYSRSMPVTNHAWKIRKYCGRDCQKKMLGPIKKLSPDRETFLELYQTRKLWIHEIASMYSVSWPTVRKWMRNFGVPMDSGRRSITKNPNRPAKDLLEYMVREERKNFRQISEMYGVDPAAIHHWLKKYDIHRLKLEDIIDKDTLSKLYESGMTLGMIGDRVGLNWSTIGTLARRYGIQLRPGGYLYNQDVKCEDGTYVRSRYEMFVGNWLLSNSIPFAYEPRIHPSRTWRSDFLANGWFVEIWGIQGDENYDARRKEKTDWYRQNRMPLIELGTKNLKDRKRIVKALSRCMRRPQQSGWSMLENTNRISPTSQGTLFDLD